jgi:hypothetical protein
MTSRPGSGCPRTDPKPAANPYIVRGWFRARLPAQIILPWFPLAASLGVPNSSNSGLRETGRLLGSSEACPIGFAWGPVPVPKGRHPGAGSVSGGVDFARGSSFPLPREESCSLKRRQPEFVSERDGFDDVV